jgi:hypothetical protein
MILPGHKRFPTHMPERAVFDYGRLEIIRKMGKI